MKKEPDRMFWLTGVPIEPPQKEPRMTRGEARLLLALIAGFTAVGVFAAMFAG